MTFFDSAHCLSMAHCKACRDKDNSGFRKSLKESFSDIDMVQFACPHGRKWGDSEKVKLVGTKLYKSGKRCRKCEKRRVLTNRTKQ